MMLIVLTWRAINKGESSKKIVLGNCLGVAIWITLNYFKYGISN